MLSGWWGSGEPTPIVYEELPSPKTEEEIRKVAEKAVEDILDFDKQEWNPVDFDEPGHPNLTLEDKTLEGESIDMIRAKDAFGLAPERVLELVATEEKDLRVEFDPDLLEMTIHKRYGDDLTIVHTGYKAPFPITNREFVVVGIKTKLEDGTYVAVSTSINHDDFPTHQTYLRAVVKLSGWIIRPIEGEPDKCSVTRIVMVNPKGAIPAMVVNLYKAKGARALAMIKDYAKKQ